jgi:hypothetical protein
MDWVAGNDPVQTIENRQKTVVEAIQTLVSSGILSDFKFIVEGREFEVHKAILAGESTTFCSRDCIDSMTLLVVARSRVFSRMFTGDFRETTANEQEVEDVSADTFEELLHFIYSGKLRNKDFPVEDLLPIADRYEVEDLMKFCDQKLLKSINDENSEKIFQLSQKIQVPGSELTKIAFEILQS